MSDLNGPSSTALLTTEQVERWRVELVEAEAKVSNLKRKLEAAAVFMSVEDTSVELNMTAGQGKTVHGWVLHVLNDRDTPQNTRSIRNAINQAGGNTGAPNYLYTALARLIDSKQIAKVGDGYVIAGKVPQGEGGGSEPPPSINKADSLSGAGPLTRSSEAGGT